MSSKQAGKAFDLPLIRRIYGLTKPYRSKFIFLVFLTVLMAVLNPARVILTQQTIDDYIVKSDSGGLLIITIIVISILIFNSWVQYIQAWLAGRMSQDIIKSLRLKVFAHINNYRLSYLDQTPVGTLVTRSISDLETLADVFSEGLVSIVGDLLQIIFIAGLMFWWSWQLTLVCLTVLPILIYTGYVFKNAVKASFIDTRNQVTRLNAFVQEHIQGMQIIQVFNRQKQEYNQFEEINRAHRDANNRGVFAYSLFFPMVELIIAISTALVVWYGSRRITDYDPNISIGLLTAFLMLITMFFRPVRTLADRFNTLQMGVVAAERIFKLLDDAENQEPEGEKDPGKIRGRIEFRNVCFRYIPNASEDILKDISFTVEPGKTLALVGATGAGKSSIIGLINRFYEINSGEIYIDDNEIRTMNPKALRRQVALVMQDVFLFVGSVYENLTLFDNSISQDEVENACRLIGIHDYIMSLPDGYNQYIHERGSTLSTGQRQLIAFVRAMLVNPSILILDEATSSIDSHSEELIKRATVILMKNRTCIVIAHRLSTIQHADEIMVIEAGRIIEKGSHQYLIDAGGQYRKLYETQFAYE